MTEQEATKTKQHLESKRPMHMGIFFLFLSNCDNKSWIPIPPDESLCGGPAALLHPATEQVKHTGFCCTELQCLQISSVTDLQKLVLTFKRTTLMFFYILFFFFRFFFRPCEKQTPKHTVTNISCADRIPLPPKK